MEICSIWVSLSARQVASGSVKLGAWQNGPWTGSPHSNPNYVWLFDQSQCSNFPWRNSEKLVYSVLCCTDGGWRGVFSALRRVAGATVEKLSRKAAETEPSIKLHSTSYLWWPNMIESNLLMSFHVHFGWPRGHTWPNLLLETLPRTPPVRPMDHKCGRRWICWRKDGRASGPKKSWRFANGWTKGWANGHEIYRERMGNKNSGILMGFAIDTKKKSFLIYNDWRRFTPGPTFRTFRNHRRGAASNMSQVGGLARDVLTQRGGHVVAPVEGDTGPPPPPRLVQSAVLWQPPQARLQSHAKSSQG